MGTHHLLGRTLLTLGCLLLVTASEGRFAPSAPHSITMAPQTTASTALTFDQAVGISSVDPVNPLGYPSAYEALFLVGNTLVTFDKKMTPQPSLATHWSVKADKRTWIFTLRSGVRFQDGTPFTAQDVKRDFDRMMDPASDLTQQAIWSHFAAVTVINPHTVAIVTKQPFAATLDYLAHGSAVILRIPSGNATSIGLHPIGTGPYTLSSLQPNTQALFSANLHYWGGKPALQRIVMRAVPNAETRVADLRAGNAQLIDAVPAVDLPNLNGVGTIHVDAAPSWATTYLDLNTHYGPLTNPLVRRAIGEAIDTNGLIRAIFRGYADPLHSPLAPSMPSYVAASTLSYNLSQAQELLHRAGYSSKDGKLVSGNRQLHLTLTAPTGLYPNDTEVAQAIQQELQGLGIKMTLRTVPAASYFTFVRQSTPTSGYGDMFLWAFNPSNGDPAYTLSINFGKPGTAAALWNKSFYNSTQLQKVLEQQSVTLNQKARLALLARAQKLIAAGTPAVWLYAPRNNIVMSSAVSGVVVLPVQFLLLANASLRSS